MGATSWLGRKFAGAGVPTVQKHLSHLGTSPEYQPTTVMPPSFWRTNTTDHTGLKKIAKLILAWKKGEITHGIGKKILCQEQKGPDLFKLAVTACDQGGKTLQIQPFYTCSKSHSI